MSKKENQKYDPVTAIVPGIDQKLREEEIKALYRGDPKKIPEVAVPLQRSRPSIFSRLVKK